MKRNVGERDRVVRAIAGAGLLVCSVMAPLPLAVRVAAFAAMGVYLLLTALAGRCLGYGLMGTSTCATGAPP